MKLFFTGPVTFQELWSDEHALTMHGMPLISFEVPVNRQSLKFLCYQSQILEVLTSIDFFTEIGLFGKYLEPFVKTCSDITRSTDHIWKNKALDPDYLPAKLDLDRLKIWLNYIELFKKYLDAG